MSGTGQAPMFQPIGGIDNFPKGFQRALGEKIALRMEVQSLKQSEHDVKVVVKDLKTGQIQRADGRLLHLVPAAHCAQHDRREPLADTMAAVKATQYSPSAKMGLQMKRRFWEEDDRIFGGHLYSNLPFGEFSYPSNGYFGQKGVLLGFYGNGRMQNVVDMPVKDSRRARAEAREQGAPADSRRVRKCVCGVLGEGPYSLGAFSGGGGGGRAGNGGNDRLATIGRPDNRIYLGCAAVSGDGSWMEGAVGAAWKQVKALHERAMATNSSNGHKSAASTLQTCDQDWRLSLFDRVDLPASFHDDVVVPAIASWNSFLDIDCCWTSA